MSPLIKHSKAIEILSVTYVTTTRTYPIPTFSSENHMFANSNTSILYHVPWATKLSTALQVTVAERAQCSEEPVTFSFWLSYYLELKLQKSKSVMKQLINIRCSDYILCLRAQLYTLESWAKKGRKGRGEGN